MTTADIAKVAWLHVRGRRLLCVRTRGRDRFYVPGGKPEPGEDDRQALSREIREELAVDLDPAGLTEHGRFAAPADGAEGRTVRAAAFWAEAAGEPRASGEIAELRYLAAADPVAVSALTRVILEALRSADVID